MQNVDLFLNFHLICKVIHKNEQIFLHITIVGLVDDVIIDDL